MVAHPLRRRLLVARDKEPADFVKTHQGLTKGVNASERTVMTLEGDTGRAGRLQAASAARLPRPCVRRSERRLNVLPADKEP